jgi:hypothetical protein
MKVSWGDLSNVQEAGRYPFRDGFVTVLEMEIAIWRSRLNTLFNLMRTGCACPFRPWDGDLLRLRRGIRLTAVC